MKLFYALALFMGSFFGMNETKTAPKDDINSKPQIPVYGIKMKTIEGDTIDFSVYKGKKLLIVNVASKCGFTKQYESLEKLHKLYGSEIIVLGFPSDDFKHQEPGSDEEIKNFCSLNYNVTFQLFSKIHVVGAEQCELYKWLSNKELNGWNSQQPTWNFCKYLINEQGELVKFFPSATKK
jgi:glutathione peroxidase